jgi:hypothetical protein
MSGNNAGVPLTRPAPAPIQHGPFRIWRGHPSPVPWFGHFEASAAFVYGIADRESDDRFKPLCHRCVVELIYRYRGFCDVSWEPIGTQDLSCDWCDRELATDAQPKPGNSQ